MAIWLTNNKLLEEYRKTKIVKHKSDEYYDIPCAFDIETSSFIDDNGEKVSILYHWQLRIGDYVETGRTNTSMCYAFDRLQKALRLTQKRKIIIYVHNLGYEFNFIRKYFNITKMFFVAPRKPLYIEIDNNIILRCSFLLSGKSLDSLGKEIGVSKLVGDLDYEKIRTPDTPLTEEEYNYCLRDVEIVTKYISRKIEQYGNVVDIPLTITGEVRHYCKSKLLIDDKCVYHKHIKYCYPNAGVFELLFKAFTGGYTHANAIFVDEELENVHSYDFTSSYPAVMLLEKYPTRFKPFKIRTFEIFDKFINQKACVFNATFKRLQSKTTHHTLSRHKCNCNGYLACDNGRIIECDEVTTTLTDVDYKLLIRFYEFENIRINKFYYADYDYLPAEFLKCIIELYKNKTVLKGVRGEEENYLLSKGMLNSLYGMCVTNPVKGKICLIGDEYVEEDVNISQTLTRQAKNTKTYLLYQWGVWVTAYARRNLLEGVLEINRDCVYCDTDSIKAINIERHIGYFERYNKNIEKRLRKLAKRINIPFDDLNPKDKDGKRHLIGVWDYEGYYDTFKTLGAKRYFYKQGDKHNITVAGLPKKAVEYIAQQENPFVFFCDEMTIPAEHAHKQTHTYIDDMRKGVVTDYLGKEYKYCQRSGIHIEKTSFKCNLLEEFIELIGGVAISQYSGKPFIDKNLNRQLKTTIFT